MLVIMNAELIKYKAPDTSFLKFLRRIVMYCFLQRLALCNNLFVVISNLLYNNLLRRVFIQGIFLYSLIFFIDLMYGGIMLVEHPP